MRQQVNVNNENNAITLKQMKVRKFHSLKYGKGRQNLQQRNAFQNQKQAWRFTPQNQQRTWTPAPPTRQNTYAPGQNGQQQSWANRAIQFRPPNKHQAAWDPWVQHPQTQNNKETDTKQNPKPIEKMDNVLKAVAPRNPQEFQQDFSRKRIPQAPVHQNPAAPAPDTTYNTAEATFNPRYQTIKQTKT